MAAHLVSLSRITGFPVDLAAMAAVRKIARIRFRPMPCDAAIEVAGESFEMHLRSAKERSVAVRQVDTAQLGSRQRFSFAHEIIHTFFYDDQLRPTRPQPKPPVLESLCNFGAQRLLLPDALIEHEFGPGGHADSVEAVVDLAEAAKVSAQVALRRLDECGSFKQSDYALLILETREDSVGLVVVAVCVGGIFLTFPRPELYNPPPEWVLRIAPVVASAEGKVFRVPQDDRWDFVSRKVSSRKHRGQMFVEIRFDAAPRLKASYSDLSSIRP